MGPGVRFRTVVRVYHSPGGGGKLRKKSENFLTFFCCGKAKEVVQADPNLIKVELGSSVFGCFALESGQGLFLMKSTFWRFFC